MNRDLFAELPAATESAPHFDDRGVDVTESASRPYIARSGYVNTTALDGAALNDAVRKAADQNAAILAIYTNAGCPLTPWEVLHRCEAAGKRWPITSVRRAITTLTDAGALVRLPTKRVGDLGRPEHEWAAREAA